jgi:hypothetical protein
MVARLRLVSTSCAWGDSDRFIEWCARLGRPEVMAAVDMGRHDNQRRRL